VGIFPVLDESEYLFGTCFFPEKYPENESLQRHDVSECPDPLEMVGQ
jgi:hypothetical protein